MVENISFLHLCLLAVSFIVAVRSALGIYYTVIIYIYKKTKKRRKVLENFWKHP